VRLIRLLRQEAELTAAGYLIDGTDETKEIAVTGMILWDKIMIVRNIRRCPVMPTSSNLVLFCLASLALILTPGPNFLYIATRGATQGRRAALLAAAGLGVGVLMHAALAALGIAALIRSSYLAFRLIKYGGSLYLAYLGLRALCDPFVVIDEMREAPEKSSRIVCQSIVASMTNPKTILFFLSFLPQFVNASAGDASAQMLFLGTVYMLFTFIVYGLVGYYASVFGRGWRTHRRLAARMRWITAGSFIGLGVWAALPDRR
jgi:threonine/homoserine/homoserine lactone efflux protein